MDQFGRKMRSKRGGGVSDSQISNLHSKHTKKGSTVQWPGFCFVLGQEAHEPLPLFFIYAVCLEKMVMDKKDYTEL